MFRRPTKEEIHMRTAFLWAERSLCKLPNRKIGCVITSEDMRQILGVGYNGNPAAMPNDSCRGITANCGCLHAEQNAVAMADGSIPSKRIFITMTPCESCANIIAQSNIDKVYYSDEYRNQDGLMRLNACHIQTTRLKVSFT
ncbi:hypothetical protein LCGC14_2158980 [marine sediment metagenome]|uniref:CMP/dCMP-type deaminase domain-containing protein n=1 Tax=marine sediment metagenome TaxID=412755 RepID=A0A0F9GPE6_9ZZZZ